MKDVLGPRHRPALERLFGSPGPGRVLLAFDYDGVLAPLVKDPLGARMRPSTRRLLVRLGRTHPTAVVTGRAFRDAIRFVDGAVAHVVGNHGFELGRPVPVPREVVARVRRWRERLEAELGGLDGVYLEDKRSTLAVHYGLARRWREAGRAVHAAAERLPGARFVPGHKVLNVLPRAFPTKGDAVRALLGRLGLDAALYLGDDVTDEDVFAIGPPRVFGVHVGPGASRAEWRLRAQTDLEAFLEVLLAAGAAGPRDGAAPRPRLVRAPRLR